MSTGNPACHGRQRIASKVGAEKLIEFLDFCKSDRQFRVDDWIGDQLRSVCGRRQGRTRSIFPNSHLRYIDRRGCWYPPERTPSWERWWALPRRECAP